MENLYAEVYYPNISNEMMLEALEDAHERMLNHQMAGEWWDRSPRLTSPFCRFEDSLRVDPTNTAYIIEDYRTMMDPSGRIRVFIQIKPLAPSFFDTWIPEEWIFVARMVGNNKGGKATLITVDIKRKEDDPEMREAAEKAEAQTLIDQINAIGDIKEGEL